ncbi:MAG: hypothetical protein V2A67_05810 [Bacteroidota bacterium]
MKQFVLVIASVMLVATASIAQVEDRKIYEGKDPFAFVNGSKPGMPVWDATLKAFVPQSGDTREVVVIDQPFSVAAGQEVVFENKIIYIQHSVRSDINIFGTLRIRNCFLSWRQTEHQQTWIRVWRGGVLDIKDSYSFRGNQYWVNWNFEDGSTIIFDHFVGDPWTAASGSVTYSSSNFSTVRFTFLSNVYNSNVRVSDAHHLWFELYPPENCTFEISFPKRTSGLTGTSTIFGIIQRLL